MRTISALLLICALALSGVAAYYSILGLATIFSSAFWPVVVMAAILEVSKLVLASWLYRHWRQVPALLKSYLTSAVIVLMVITSLGIFGFLSRAHVDQALVTSEAQLRLEQIQTDIANVQMIRERYEAQLQQLDRSINIQLDANRAQGALAARRQQQAERNQIRERLDQEMIKLADLNRERTRIRQQVNVVESEVGPIRYVAEFFSKGDVDLELAVRWMILVIVLVFDPLAVLMLIAANMGLTRKTRSPPSEAPVHTHAVARTPDEPLAPSEPEPGTVRWDPKSESLVSYTAQGWQPMHMPNADPPSEGMDGEQIQQIMHDTLDKWLQRSVKIQETVDPDVIRDTVAQTVRTTMSDLINPGVVGLANPGAVKSDSIHNKNASLHMGVVDGNTITGSQNI
jgi:hypothetical protein